MAQIDNGPATGNASLWLGVPPTASVEVHVGNGPQSPGTNSLAPSDTVVTVDPSISTNLQAQSRLSMNLGGCCTIKFVNPA